ncbi:biopolymer transporter ExbD [Leptolyngbya sp. FACHB-711]|uniref:ExbD/TolR family protein n=1 Tax=unclassified Leptolyngbya TaxID=2650499 RepID=UPI001687B15E|nr:biopolymer transporter ExbD [Leptolyngbya sp. FACHB-711]MBD1853549.1 biopolymer transporter ExbD [Cyanobacteria bacterium FACHB-502]MBD2024448.1 biopolymer transporter ExbD [Leptolyngbya sp. FACHB-711]
MNIPEEPDDLPYINIVPMIDVVFAILTFFIMSSLFLSRSEGLPVNLPQAQTAQSQQQSKLTVTIDREGDVFLDRQPIQVNDLANRVKALIGNQERLVVINADEKVEHGQVIAVMDQLRSVQGVKLGISARRP